MGMWQSRRDALNKIKKVARKSHFDIMLCMQLDFPFTHDNELSSLPEIQRKNDFKIGKLAD